MERFRIRYRTPIIPDRWSYWRDFPYTSVYQRAYQEGGAAGVREQLLQNYANYAVEFEICELHYVPPTDAEEPDPWSPSATAATAPT